MSSIGAVMFLVELAHDGVGGGGAGVGEGEVLHDPRVDEDGVDGREDFGDFRDGGWEAGEVGIVELERGRCGSVAVVLVKLWYER